MLRVLGLFWVFATNPVSADVALSGSINIGICSDRSVCESLELDDVYQSALRADSYANLCAAETQEYAQRTDQILEELEQFTTLFYGANRTSEARSMPLNDPASGECNPVRTIVRINAAIRQITEFFSGDSYYHRAAHYPTDSSVLEYLDCDTVLCEQFCRAIYPEGLRC